MHALKQGPFPSSAVIWVCCVCDLLACRFVSYAVDLNIRRKVYGFCALAVQERCLQIQTFYRLNESCQYSVLQILQNVHTETMKTVAA
jgi:hypothetical protein